jgi:hypothetical protein
MTTEQRKLFPFIEKKMIEEKARLSGGYKPVGDTDKVHVPMFSLGGIEFVEDHDIRLALSLGNPKELLELTKKTLINEGFTSVDSLRNLQNLSLTAFAKNRHGSFRDGLTMVNLNLNESNSVLTPTKMSIFMELLRKSGFPSVKSNRSYEYLLVKKDLGVDNVEQPINKTLGDDQRPKHRKAVTGGANIFIAPKKIVSNVYNVASLAKHTQKLFGVEAEFTVNLRDLHGKKPVFVGMGTIQLPEGFPLTSTIKHSDTELQSNERAAAELGQMIDNYIKTKKILLYEGSRWYQNHLKIVPLVLHEYQYSGPFYTITNRDGIYVVQASIEKYGMKIIGNPAINADEKMAHEHADVSLARKILKTLAVSADVNPKNEYIKKLQLLSRSIPFKIQTEVHKIKVKETTIYEVQLSAMGVKKNGYGIFRDHAEEKASENLYKALSSMELSGGRTMNN